MNPWFSIMLANMAARHARNTRPSAPMPRGWWKPLAWCLATLAVIVAGVELLYRL